MSTGAVFPSPTITPLYAYELRWSCPSCRFLCEAWWTCFTGPQQRHTWRNRSDCVLATEEPMSVLLPSISRRMDIDIKPEPRWQGTVPDWRGIPCRIGRAEMWLPVQGNLPLRPFSLLVLLPRRDPRERLPYVHLGVQFILEYRVRVVLEGSQAPVSGGLQIP